MACLRHQEYSAEYLEQEADRRERLREITKARDEENRADEMLGLRDLLKR